MSTSLCNPWYGFLYRLCELEVPLNICTIANGFWKNLLFAYTLTQIIVPEVTIYVYDNR